MVGITSIALFALGATAEITSRTITGVFSDLRQVDLGVQNLSSQVANYDGTLKAWGPTQQRINAILSDLRLTATEARNTAQATADDSNVVISFIDNILGPDITTLVDNYLNQRPKFFAAGLKSVTRLSATYLRGNTTNVATDLIPKLATSTQASASAAFNKIDGDWLRFVNAYS